jgi:peptidoglycan/xylan/chitin deacetylase (PgdA/CDA1 family)
MYRRFGWLVLAGLAANAHAGPPPAGAADPLPPEARTEAAPDRDARPRTVATATPAPAAALDIKDLRTLTDDPMLGKARRVEGEERKGFVAFTFDDGPNPETTPAVIAALQKYDIPAAFFIVTQRIGGKHGEKSRELLERELAGGFLVGSHSVTHRNLKHAAGDQLAREIDASIRTLAVQASRPIGLFRPPYGSLSPAGRVRLKKLGLTEVFWSVDTLDWKAHNPERLRKKVISMIKHDGGGVVLMHDVKPITAQIIGEVFDDLEAENCARLAAGHDLILPVSLHYFLRDGKAPRALPEAVKQRTEAYRAALPERCARRPPTPEPPPPPRHAAR